LLYEKRNVASKLDTGYYTQAYLTTHTDRGSSKSGIHNTDKIARPGKVKYFKNIRLPYRFTKYRLPILYSALQAIYGKRKLKLNQFLVEDQYQDQ